MSDLDQPSLFDRSDPIAADQQARSRVARDLDATLFVEAGAGSGKTRSLVDRVVSLIASGIPMHRIVAITFTERAAAELRHRLRLRIAAQESDADPPALWSAALDELDGAAVSTLHAFAQRLLGEHPIEAGLPPNVEVLDEISSQVEFDAQWRTMTDRLFDDPALSRTLELALALGITTDQLRTVALEFTSNWDLVAAHPPGSTDDPPPVRIEPVLDALHALGRERDHCLVDVADDRMATKLDDLATLADRLERAADDASTLELLDPKRTPSFKPGVGSKKHWPDGVLDAIRDDLLPAAEHAIDQTVAPVREACLQRLVHHLGTFVIEDAERRRTEGRLRFHDLLVHARRLLADAHHGPAVRAALSGRYQRLL
ncbi:MAG: UvrD-helicase domain-containing protein, partial [Acidimicrobiales bacterium]